MHSRSSRSREVSEVVTLAEIQNKNKSTGLRSKIHLWRGDITKLKIDAIVNAANTSLLGGGGVDGAIHAAAGWELLEECKELDGCETGGAKITKGYQLPAKHVIHAVGPMFRNRKSDKEKLSGCYETSLNLLAEHKLKSIAFPCISTGIYGYPNKDAARVALETVENWMYKNPDRVEAVIFCLFLKEDVRIYEKEIEKYFAESSEMEVDNPEYSSEKTDKISNDQRQNEAKEQDSCPKEIICNQQSSLNKKLETRADDLSAGQHSNIVEDAVTGAKDNQGHPNEYENRATKGRDEDKRAIEAADHRDNQNSNEKEKQETRNDLQGNPPLNSTEEKATEATDLRETAKKDLQQELSPSERLDWIQKFESLELELNRRPVLKNTEPWLDERHFSGLLFVGGLDISYHKTENKACVSLVILSFPNLELVYENSTIEVISTPYIPGYLAYREADHFKEKLQAAKDTKYSPQVVLVDGNGILHPRRYGSAVMVGLDADLPTIGVAKNLMVMEEFGISREKIEDIESKGGTIDITTDKGEIIGKAVRTSDKSHKPVFVSVGHKCNLETAVALTLACCRHKIPEPIRQVCKFIICNSALSSYIILPCI